MPKAAPKRKRAGSERGARAKLPPRIKVYRTHIGMNDWVVATSSQKAALEAWDVSRNLFASGEAAVTEDPDEIEAALADIGKPVPLRRRRR